MTRKPTIRYFSRIRGKYGFLYAKIRYLECRKTISTKILISKEQGKRLCSDGRFLPPWGEDDAELEHCIIENYTAAALAVARNLIDAGRFDSTPGKDFHELITEEITRQRIADFDFVNIEL